MSRKLLIIIICLIIVLLTVNKRNTSLGEAESVLIAHMLENERAVEIFSMDGEVVGV